MGIIKDKVEKAFSEFKASIDNQIETKECLSGLVSALVDVADRSVNCEGHRKLLDKAIKESFTALEVE